MVDSCALTGVSRLGHAMARQNLVVYTLMSSSVRLVELQFLIYRMYLSILRHTLKGYPSNPAASTQKLAETETLREAE